MKIKFNLTVMSMMSAGLLLGGCAAPTHKPMPISAASTASETPPQNGGRYYKDDGPGSNPPEGLDRVPDAQPKAEPLHRHANNPYRIMGVTYTPDTSGKPFKETGHASWYGRRYHDKPTASGETYNMYAMTAAHRTLPIPSYVKVTNLANSRSVVVRINDRGPFHSDRVIDLSYTAAYKLDLLKGPGEVSVELVSAQGEPSPLAEPIRLYKAEPPQPIQAKPLEASAATTTSPAAKTEPVGERFWLQLGAFSRKESADALASRASGLGADVPGVVQRESGSLIKVQTGPYASAAEADRVAARMQSELGIKPRRVDAATEGVQAPQPSQAASPVAAPPAIAQAAPPVPSTPATLATVGNASQPGIYLQVAAVSKPEAAEVLLEKLQGQTLPGLHRFTTGTVTRVQVGPFSGAEQAEAAANALEKLLGFKPFRVVK